jgi:hypothetical protein
LLRKKQVAQLDYHAALLKLGDGVDNSAFVGMSETLSHVFAEGSQYECGSNINICSDRWLYDILVSVSNGSSDD